MFLTYDKSACAAYIYLKHSNVILTYCCDPTKETGVNGQINLDFDKNNNLIGLEILDANKFLSEDLQKIIKNQKETYSKYDISENVQVENDEKNMDTYIYFGTKKLKNDIKNIYKCDKGEIPINIELYFDIEGRLIGLKLR